MASDQLEKNTRTGALLTLASRVTGVIRDGAISRVFGTSVFASAFYFAFLIPNLFRRLFGEGALAAAFLPAYSKLHYKDPELAKAFATLTLSLLIVVLGSIVFVCELILLAILSMQDTPSNSLQLAMIMLPYMPLVCVVAIFSAMLHVHNRFGPPAAAPIILNGAMILAITCLGSVFKEQMDHIKIIGVSVVIAGVIQIGWALFSLRSIGWYSSEIKTAYFELKSLISRTIPMIIGLGTLQINTLLDGVIASWATIFGPTVAGYEYPLNEGAMSALSFGQRLYQFPLGVFGVAIAAAIYPLLAKQFKHQKSFANTLRRGLRFTVFIGLPASAGLILVREPLIVAVFQGGEFTFADTVVVSSILLGYAPAIWAYSMVQVLTKGFYAQDDTLTPVKVAIFCVLLNLLLNVTLIWTPLNISGLAWSTALCAVVQVSALMVLFSKRINQLIDSDVLWSWGKSALLTFLMIISISLCLNYIVPSSDWTSPANAIKAICILVPASVIFYFIGSILLNMPEFKWILGKNN